MTKLLPTYDMRKFHLLTIFFRLCLTMSYFLHFNLAASWQKMLIIAALLCSIWCDRCWYLQLVNKFIKLLWSGNSLDCTIWSFTLFSICSCFRFFSRGDTMHISVVFLVFPLQLSTILFEFGHLSFFLIYCCIHFLHIILSFIWFCWGWLCYRKKCL